jgi:hypothetical protein
MSSRDNDDLSIPEINLSENDILSPSCFISEQMENYSSLDQKRDHLFKLQNIIINIDLYSIGRIDNYLTNISKEYTLEYTHKLHEYKLLKEKYQKKYKC